MSVMRCPVGPEAAQVRLMIATFAFVCAWLVTAVLEAMRAPDWTLFMGGAVILVSIVTLVAALHLWTQAGDAGEPEPERRSDEGGGGPRRQGPDAPQPGGGGSDPSWWPEFERRLALYVAERERENRPPAVVASEPAAKFTATGLPESIRPFAWPGRQR